MSLIVAVAEDLVGGLGSHERLAALVVRVYERSIAATRSATEVKDPRYTAWQVMIEKNDSTRLSQLADVGVKCSVIRGCRSSQARTVGCLWVA